MSHLKPIRKQGIMNKQVGDETLLYDMHEGTIHILNRTAHMIWNLCNGHYTADDIQHKLKDQFAFPPDCDLIGDVRQALSIFKQKGLLQHNMRS